MNEPLWVTWSRELQAIAQNGLTFCKNSFDIARYESVRSIATDMMAKGFEDDPQKVDFAFQNQNGYATPKVDVRTAAFRDGKILLVKELSDGKWALPGGWADINDSPAEAAVREVWEEAGFEVEISKLAAVYDRAKRPHVPAMPFHVYKLFFIGEITGGAAKTSNETSDVAFFAEDDLPDMSLGRVLPTQVSDMFRHFREPALPTIFD